MMTARLVVVFTIINFVLMVAGVLHFSTTALRSDAAVLRGSALELLDSQGQIRAHLRVEPDGEVVLRLRDANGNIRVKLGADANGSGIVLLNDATDVGIHILAKAEGSSLKLANPDGRGKVIVP